MQRLLLSIVLIVLPAALRGQTGQIDNESAVREALTQASQGTYTSTSQKHLGRLGDASAVALTKIIGGNVLDEKDVESILLIITLSYSDVRIVETERDRQPRTTLFLLRYLELAATDAKLRDKIANTRGYVGDQYAKSLKESAPAPANNR